MGHRLSKIYTRTGDNGTTGLADGSRIDKDDPRVEAYGTVDELNSLIGLILSNELPDDISAMLVSIQHTLFNLGASMSYPDSPDTSESQVNELEQWLDKLNSDLSPLKEFILPGGAVAAAHCHVARTVCRRAERRVITLGKTTSIPENSVKYLNRLSDLLFVMARYINAANNHHEPLWQPDRNC